MQGPAERVRAVLFGRATPHFGSVPAQRKWKAVNRYLNTAQLEAIDFALAASDIALIHGPPGTGKTTTVVELIVQCVKAGQKVLAAAPSNVAVDNLTERLAAAGVRLVRLGHPARVLPSVIDSTLDVQVERSESKSLANDARCEINQALRKLSKKGSKGAGTQDAGERKAERSSLRRELTALRKEVREREQKAVGEIMGGAQVVLCTNAGAALRDVDEAGEFDVCVIDEAAMALEVSCWIPILKAKKLVLAGDHRQLAPPVMSKEAEAQGLGTTLFDRVLSLHGEQCVRMLTVQYRMHRDISDWRSCFPLRVPPSQCQQDRTSAQQPRFYVRISGRRRCSLGIMQALHSNADTRPAVPSWQPQTLKSKPQTLNPETLGARVSVRQLEGNVRRAPGVGRRGMPAQAHGLDAGARDRRDPQRPVPRRHCRM